MRQSWFRAHFARSSRHTVAKKFAPRRRRLRIEWLESRHMMSVNPIMAENLLPGTPQSQWDLVAQTSSEIAGYTADISYDIGQTVEFKISTAATSYRIDIYRMGYYGGDGARLVTSLFESSPSLQPGPIANPTTGLEDYGTWGVTATWTIPEAAVSGVYFANLVRTDGVSGANQMYFVVRDDNGNSDLLFKTSDATWQAYNSWGGESLYEDDGDLAAGRAFAVSYNRPFNNRTTGITNSVFYTEYPMIRWLEANGYDVSYFTDVDANRYGNLLLNHKTFLSVGHDEYWSAEERTNVEAARDAGVDLAFFGGNDVFWKVTYADAIDGTSTPYRTLISYKTSLDYTSSDPNSSIWTGTWRDPTSSPPLDGGYPENALTGTMFAVNGDGTGGYAMQVSAEEGQMRLWRNTSIAELAPGDVATLTNRTLGYEWNIDANNGFRPAGLINLSSTTMDVALMLQDAGGTYGPGKVEHSLTMYRAASGALVFSAGSIQWSWGLDGNHDWIPSVPDPRVQQATVNLFADMGVQAGSLQAGLVQTTASTDFTKPTSTITSLTNGSTVLANGAVFITGTAQDSGGGVVGGIEISVDGGQTWFEANGRRNWTYQWNPSTPGAYRILTRAADDSGNLEIPSAGITVNVVAATSQSSIWNDSTLPAITSNPDINPVELGMKFTTTAGGYLTGMRFYKGVQNIGTHVGHLWSSTGTLLATVTFANETPSGWQTALFATPVQLQANTTYVLSYYAPQGRYAVTPSYFSAGGVTNGNLRALGDGENGSNGLFFYGGSGFPTGTYSSANYWVDPIVAQASVTIAPGDGTGNVAVGSTITATFSAAMSAATINANTIQLRDGTGAVVAATVSYNATTRVATLTPTSPLSSGMTYTVAVLGQPGGIADSQGVALGRDVVSTFTTEKVTYGPEQALWSSSAVPQMIDSTDGGAVEVGLKFQANVDGFVTGVQFYKAANNTGMHTGSLWTTDGQLLSTVTFTNETASGWQYASFSSPVAVKANTTYVISYYAPFGHYSVTPSGLNSAISSGALTALASTAANPNGVFRYGKTGFPSSSYSASNYWVSPVFVGKLVDRITPVFGTTDFAADAPITISFTRAMDVASITTNSIQLYDADLNLMPATVTYSAASRTATLTPLNALGSNASYTVVVRGRGPGVKDASGNAMPEEVVSLFTAVPPSAAPQSVWTSSATPAIPDTADPGAVELGMKFNATANGYITGVRFFKSTMNTGVHVGSLWTADGTRLASVTFTGESASGWQQALFSTPVAIQANTTYVISYYAPNGRFSMDVAGLSGGVSNGALNVQGGADAGVFQYGGSAFPTSSYQASNYWVDVVFVKSPIASVSPAAGATGMSLTSAVAVAFNTDMNVSSINNSTIQLKTTAGASIAASVTYNTATRTATLTPATELAYSTQYTITVVGGANGIKDSLNNTLPVAFTSSFTTVAPPSVSSITPSAGATNVSTISAVSIVFGQAMSAATLTAANLKLQDSSGAQIAITIIYNPTTRTATLTPSATLANGTTYTVVVVGGTSGVRDALGNTLPTNVTSSFTTVPVAAASYSVWGGTPTPAIVDSGEVAALEVGMKFRVTADGFISGVSFYKAAANTGSHIGHLWSSSGTLLATVTFTGETASGWQTAQFSNPVAVQANTTYLVSYYAPRGRYSMTIGGLANTIDAGPLQALGGGVDGVNGVFRYGSSGFPTDSWSSSNYWVDVVYVKSPIASVSPISGATGVALSSAVTVTFNTDMNAASIGGSTIQLKTAAGATVPANVTYNATTRTATLTPTSTLSYSTQYTVAIVGGTSGVKDKANNTLPVAYTSNFTTISPPSIASITPSANATNVGVNSAISIVFGQVMDATTLTAANLKLQDSTGAQVAVSISYNGSTRSATLTPTTSLANSATYTVTVLGGTAGVRDASGNTLPADVSSSFTTVPVAPPFYSVWGGAVTPAMTNNGDPAAVEVGMKFRVDADGFITGMSFYKSTANTGTHVGHLWSSNGMLLATVTFTGETASAWQTALFSNPVAVKANATYVISYFAPKGNYAITVGGLASTIDAGPVHALGSGVDGNNGVFRYGSMGFPTSSWSSSNYWVDVVYVKSPVASITPADGATGVPRSTSISIVFNTEMDAATINATNLQLRNSSGTLIPANVVYNSATQTVIITPVSQLARSTKFTLILKGGASGVRDRFGNLLPADISWSFTSGLN
ncbi:MAG: DUF4082 domain-containing protein [Pirellulales bacterium]|nr:DUF4082 domain-containing protein [Pirellulales bacterium]